MVEVFSVLDVYGEFVGNVGKEYYDSLSTVQLNLCHLFLQDFVSKCVDANLVFTRIPDQVPQESAQLRVPVGPLVPDPFSGPVNSGPSIRDYPSDPFVGQSSPYASQVQQSKGNYPPQMPQSQQYYPSQSRPVDSPMPQYYSQQPSYQQSQQFQSVVPNLASSVSQRYPQGSADSVLYPVPSESKPVITPSEKSSQVDLSSDKPKTFIDKLRGLKFSKRGSNINPVDD